MTVTLTPPTRVETDVWEYVATSTENAPLYRWWVDGELHAVTRRDTIRVTKATEPTVACTDDPDVEVLFETRPWMARMQWLGIDGAAYYVSALGGVEQNPFIPHEGVVYHEALVGPLDTESDNTITITPYDDQDNAGAALSKTITMARQTDQSSVSFSYDAGTGDITVDV